MPLVNKANDYTGHTHLFLGPQKTEEQLAMEGEYMLNYNTLKPIGKGAFGFVRLAQHLADGTMVCFCICTSMITSTPCVQTHSGLVSFNCKCLSPITREYDLSQTIAFTHPHGATVVHSFYLSHVTMYVYRL